jgi:hypothetical protein
VNLGMGACVRVFFCGHPRVSACVPVVSACGKQASSELTGTVSVSAFGAVAGGG